MEKILLWYGNQMKSISMGELRIKLRNAYANISGTYECYGVLRRKFTVAYRKIEHNLNVITCIQMYEDGVVRLHLKYNHFDTPKSIFINDANLCNDERFRNLMNALMMESA